MIMSHTGAGCKALPEKGLQDGESSVTPSVTPTDGKPCVPGVSSFNLTPSEPLACESGTNCVLASTGKGIREGVLKENGAGHGVRTRDIQLGKLALYQLS